MSSNSISDVIDAFKDFTVLIIGDAILDSYIWGDANRISSEAPVPIIHIKKKDYRLGGAANVALNISALGAKPILCSMVGQDKSGDQLLKRLKERKMVWEGLIISDTRSTTVKTRIIAGHQQVLRIDEGSDEAISRQENEHLIKNIEKFLPQCHLVIFEDYDKGVISPELIKKVVILAEKKGIPTIVDPKKKNFLSYQNVTLIKPNLKELQEGLGLEVDTKDLEELKRAVRILKEKTGADVMVTLSSEGVFINHQSEEIKIPAHPREIADVSGAGDTVVSIAGLCVALNLKPRLIASLANLGGGLACQHVGVVPIGRDELVREAQKKKIDAG